jgi:hypothetical protein
VTMLRQIEVSIANGRSTPQAWGHIHQALSPALNGGTNAETTNCPLAVH